MYKRSGCILHVFVSDERSLAYSSKIFRSLGFVGGGISGTSSNRIRSLDGRIRVHFTVDPVYSKIRTAMNQPAFYLLTGLSRVLEPMKPSEKAVYPAENLSLMTAFRSNVPYMPPYFRIVGGDNDIFHHDDHDSDPINPRATSQLKEIILPCSTLDFRVLRKAQSHLSDIGATPYRNVPGMYKIELSPDANEPGGDTSRLLVRTAPTSQGSLIFKVDDIEETLGRLREEGIRGDRLGFTGAWSRSEGFRSGGGEVRLYADIGAGGAAHPRPRGLDVRITDSDEVLSYFSEGPEAVLDGTIAGIQSERVLGNPSESSADSHLVPTGAARKASATINNGDCWMEFRAMMKTPWRLMTEKRVAGDTRQIPADYPMKE